ncbi:Rv1733c family protein, partial [Streptomyces sp. NPDC004561]
MAFRGPKVWLWRWRSNPLKRRADMVEGWVVLCVWLLTVLAGVLAGLAAAGGVEHGLAQERTDWRPALARVVGRAPGTRPAQKHTAGGERVWAKVRWTVADGTAHTGQVRVAPGSRPGTPVTVWTDPGGHLVNRPTSASEATFRAVLVGGLVGI